MSQPSAGWYDDPDSAGTLRYWDGARWTEHREPKQAGAQQAAPPQGYQNAQPHYQGSPYAGANRYQGAPYPPPRKKKSGGPVIAIVLVVGLVIVTGLIWQVVRSVGDLTGTAGGSTPSSSATSTDDVPVYYMGERPGWQDMSSYVEGLHEKYSAALDDGTIVKYVADTDEGLAYAEAFVLILTDYKVALMWSGSTPSTEASDLDDQIAGMKSEVAEYERRFLAGENLGMSIRIVYEDGTVFESDGVAPELIYDDPEEFAQNFRPQPGADGTYVDAAAELAAGFGMEVTYNYAPGADGCTPSKHPLESLGAVFCPVTPNLIWVNPANSQYPDILQQESFVHMIRHEIGHRQILDQCGTIAPPIALDVWEGVTNAYAVLYLGADQDLLGGIDDSYAMTDQTFEMAEAIHGGTCY